MKLKSLKVKNFRQFFGEQGPIKFPATSDKNITMIFGANGAGKTTILNAFTWTLYQETTEALENPENLTCERAILEADEGEDVEASVSIDFEHDGKTYHATRRRVVRKTGSGLQKELREPGELILQVTDETGNTSRSRNPEDQIAQVLPERLHDFFFFDGERIERLTNESTYEEVGKAIKNLLGLELLDRATRHLGGEVKSRLDDQLSEVGTSETQEIVKKIKEKEAKIEEEESNLELKKENKRELEQDLDEVKSRLRGREETQKIQERLDELESQESDIQSTLKTIDDNIDSLISGEGFKAFLDEPVKQSYEIIEEKRTQGQIPSGIKKQFVEDLLEKGECICGTEIEEGTDHYQHVKSWLEKAGLSEVEEAAQKVWVQLKSFKEDRTTFYDELEQLTSRRARKKEELESVREKISEENRKLDDKDSEPVQELTEKRDELNEEIDETTVAIGGIQQRLESLQEKLDALEDEKEEAKAESRKEALIQERLRVVRETVGFFQELHDLRSDEVREELDDRIKEVYGKISYKDYWPEITEDYNLLLRKGIDSEDDTVSHDVAKSTGENQILSLAFIGSVADFAREQYEESNGGSFQQGLGFEGGIYPIVMDSPFGALDTNYREAISSGVPELADQVSVIVSKSQGLGTVHETMKNNVDRIYVLSYHTPKEDHKREEITIDGSAHPYIEKTKETEWAEIREVK